MCATTNWSCHYQTPQKSLLKYSPSNERKILKAVLIERLNKLFCELFKTKIHDHKNQFILECYEMDNKIIQLIIQGIVETGEYTLEGIAYHTRIPLDVLYDALIGINNQLSVTPWTKIVYLYMQVNPDIAKLLIDKLLELKNKDLAELLLLLSEK